MAPSPGRRVAVLGGGPSGMVLAHSLAADPAVEVHLIERREALGGLFVSRRFDGLEFDIGAFVFALGHEFVRSFSELDRLMTPATLDRTAIYPSGRAAAFPFAARDFAAEYGALALGRAAVGVARARWRRRPTATSADFLRGYLGSHLYELSGLRHYVEILHQLPDREIGLEFAQQRLEGVYEEARRRRAGSLGAWRRYLARPEPEAILVRPAAGFRAVHAHIEGCLRDRGVNVHLGVAVERIEPLGGGAARLHAGTTADRYDAVFSTIPLPLALRLIGRTPAARYDQVALLSLFYRGALRPPGTVLYNMSRGGSWKRLTVFSRWYGAPSPGEDYFTVEITTRDTSPATLDALRHGFEADARRLGIVAGTALRCVGHEVTERAYPVFHHGEADRMADDHAALRQSGLIAVGRQGRFAFISSHQAARDARGAAAARH